jgi:hypothetical protein
MSNVAAGADALGWKSIASVLVGAGQGNLDLRTALGEFVEGIGTGLQQIREERRGEPTLRRVEIVERSPARFGEIATALAQLAAENGRSTSAVRLALREPSAGDVRRANAASLEGASPGGIALAKAAQGKGSRGKAARAEATSPSRPGTSDRVTLGETRLAVECASAGVFRFSALSDAAVVPVREVPVNLRIAIDAGEALRRSRTRDEQEKFGRLLYTYLVPEDFHEYVDAQVPLRLIVDRASASFPWEMACFPPRSGEGLRWLGLDALALSRQFRTLLARAPGVSPPLNDRLRVLVVADPAPERELQLPGARSEGRRVVDVLERMNGRGNGDGPLEIEVVRRIGASECEPVEVLALLLSGDFDIVHFAGHGAYDPAKPDESGWVFGRDTVLTARDIFRARRVPRLVFANACFSGVIREGVALAPDEAAPALATIAQAFLERGVPNYVGTGWAVDDAQAALVAGMFYESLLARATLGAALASARRAAYDRQVESTWGAYQHYGNPGDTVVRPVAPGGRG